MQYASHGHDIREGMKSIRTREEALDELKRRRKNVIGKADAAEKKLSKMSPEHKNMTMQTETLNLLRDQIRGMDADILSEEAALGDYKRSCTRSFMGLKFGGLLECCEKGAVSTCILTSFILFQLFFIDCCRVRQAGYQCGCIIYSKQKF